MRRDRQGPSADGPWRFAGYRRAPALSTPRAPSILRPRLLSVLTGFRYCVHLSETDRYTAVPDLCQLGFCLSPPMNTRRIRKDAHNIELSVLAFYQIHRSRPCERIDPNRKLQMRGLMNMSASTNVSRSTHMGASTNVSRSTHMGASTIASGRRIWVRQRMQAVDENRCVNGYEWIDGWKTGWRAGRTAASRQHCSPTPQLQRSHISRQLNGVATAMPPAACAGEIEVGPR